MIYGLKSRISFVLVVQWLSWLHWFGYWASIKQSDVHVPSQVCLGDQSGVYTEKDVHEVCTMHRHRYCKNVTRPLSTRRSLSIVRWYCLHEHEFRDEFFVFLSPQLKRRRHKSLRSRERRKTISTVKSHNKWFVISLSVSCIMPSLYALSYLEDLQ